jgi:hypothetical protein
MKYRYTVTYTFKCEERTCDSEAGLLCEHVSTSWRGGALRCALFDSILASSEPDGRGWILRCPECLRSAEKVTEE